jgi:hypothetical protein
MEIGLVRTRAHDYGCDPLAGFRYRLRMVDCHRGGADDLAADIDEV